MPKYVTYKLRGADDARLVCDLGDYRFRIDEVERLVGTTDLFRGEWSRRLAACGRPPDGRIGTQVLRLYKTLRRKRFETRPFFGSVWTAVAGVERLILTDWLVRAARISGQVVAIFRKPRTGGEQ